MDPVGTWFAVLPDHPGATDQGVRLEAPRVLSYASGRPWLVGSWADAGTAVAEAGAARIAVIGQHSVTDADLLARLSRLRDVRDLDGLGAGLAGSFHLVAAVGGRVRVQGSASGMTRVFYARCGGVPIAADRAGLLASLIGARPDEARLALRLASGGIPHPLSVAPVWRDVHGVPPGHCLIIDAGGNARLRRWWVPPEPSVPLDAGAPILREALTEAVAVRTRRGGTVSCDLSGGLDSSPICVLADRGESRLIALTQTGLDPANDDVMWANQVGRHLNDTERLILDPRELPHRFAAMERSGFGMDEPLDAARDFARITALGRLMAERGSRVHLGGHGGDQVVSLQPSYVHTIIRTHPRIGLRHLRGYCAQYRWPLFASLRLVAGRRSYGAWLAAAADKLTAPEPTINTPFLSWGSSPRLPPWVTPRAIDAVRDLLRSVVGAEPLAGGRGEHAALDAVQHSGNFIRSLGSMWARGGVELAAPYVDDRVVEAALAVRLHERADPWHFKPLHVAAMRGVVSDSLLERRTKATRVAEVNEGLRRHRDELVALLDDSILGRLGLIDVEVARGAVLGRYSNLQPTAVTMVLATEAWLRAHDQHPAAAKG